MADENAVAKDYGRDNNFFIVTKDAHVFLVYGKNDTIYKNMMKNKNLYKWAYKYLIQPQEGAKVLILSHNDPDGHLSSAIMAKAFGMLDDANSEVSVKVYNVDYEYDFKHIENDIKEANLIFITDLSLTQEPIDYITSTMTGQLFWIDHHQSSTNVKINNHKDDVITLIQEESGISAAALCCFALAQLTLMNYTSHRTYGDNIKDIAIGDFKEAYYNNVRDFTLPNRIVDVVGGDITRNVSWYDTWYKNDQYKEQMSIKFIYRFQSQPLDINTIAGIRFWKMIMGLDQGKKDNRSSIEYSNLMNIEGTIINDFLVMEHHRCLDKQAIEFTIDVATPNGSSVKHKKYSCLAINANGFSSLFEENAMKYDGLLRYYQQSDGRWNYGLYAEEARGKDKIIDCKTVAEFFGGGGHVNAAGFVTDTNIMDKVIHSSTKTLRVRAKK